MNYVAGDKHDGLFLLVASLTMDSEVTCSILVVDCYQQEKGLEGLVRKHFLTPQKISA